VTHELNNVLGTIEQVTGLIEDLAETDAIRDHGVAEKILSVVDRVGKQAERGAGLIKRLNSFAHLTDEGETTCNLAELLENIVALSERKARMGKATLVTAGLDREIIITASPLLVVQFVYGAIKRALAIADPTEPIRISLTRSEAGGEISIDVRCGQGVPEDKATDTTAACATRLGGRIEETDSDGLRTIKLVIPYK